MYLSLLMLERWPDNLYLHTLVCKNFYWLTYYKKQTTLKKVLDNYKQYEGSPYGEYLCFLAGLNSTRMFRVAQDYLEGQKESFGSQEDMDILLAKLIELNGSFKQAKPLYEQYLSDYPEGKYQYFAERKLRKQP